MKIAPQIPKHIPFVLTLKNNSSVKISFADKSVGGQPMSVIELEDKSCITVVYFTNFKTNKSFYCATHETPAGEKLFFELIRPEEKKSEFIQKLTDYLNSLDA